MLSKQQHESARESITENRAVLVRTRDFLGRIREFYAYTSNC